MIDETEPTRGEAPSGESRTSGAADEETGTQRVPPEVASLPAELRQRYRVTGELGRGGMGVVLAAFDRQLRRPVAIKLVTDQGSLAAQERFHREAALLARLEHPATPRVYDFASPDEACPYLVMEPIDGVPLDPSMGRDRCLEALLQVAEALDEVHQQGLLHRDVKHANILVSEAGEAHLVDFGLALDPTQTRHTVTGELLGTLAFLAPELFLEHSPATPGSDWYAWGVTAAYLLGGALPRTTQDILVALRSGEPPEPDLAGLGQDPLRTPLAALLTAEPEARRRIAQGLRGRFREALSGGEGARTAATAPRTLSAVQPRPVAPTTATALASAPPRSAEPPGPAHPPPPRTRSAVAGLAALGVLGLGLGFVARERARPPEPHPGKPTARPSPLDEEAHWLDPRPDASPEERLLRRRLLELAAAHLRDPAELGGAMIPHGTDHLRAVAEELLDSRLPLKVTRLLDAWWDWWRALERTGAPVEGLAAAPSWLLSDRTLELVRHLSVDLRDLSGADALAAGGPASLDAALEGERRRADLRNVVDEWTRDLRPRLQELPEGALLGLSNLGYDLAHGSIPDNHAEVDRRLDHPEAWLLPGLLIRAKGVNLSDQVRTTRGECAVTTGWSLDLLRRLRDGCAAEGCRDPWLEAELVRFLFHVDSPRCLDQSPPVAEALLDFLERRADTTGGVGLARQQVERLEGWRRRLMARPETSASLRGRLEDLRWWIQRARGLQGDAGGFGYPFWRRWSPLATQGSRAAAAAWIQARQRLEQLSPSPTTGEWRDLLVPLTFALATAPPPDPQEVLAVERELAAATRRLQESRAEAPAAWSRAAVQLGGFVARMDQPVGAPEAHRALLVASLTRWVDYPGWRHLRARRSQLAVGPGQGALASEALRLLAERPAERR